MPAPAAATEFTLEAAPQRLRTLLSRGPLALAAAFVSGELDVSGDLVAAVRSFSKLRGVNAIRRSLAWGRALAPWLQEHLAQTESRAARNVRAHYDRSNEFYRCFLDDRLVYSCAYFHDAEMSLEEAQLAKLRHICRKLAFEPGQKFLDIGCGWGALVVHAANNHGVVATGCTLSHEQAELARAVVSAQAPEGHAQILEADYRDLIPAYDRIASVGMFEHVGRSRLREYFETVRRLLAPGGLFLNHGITRPEPVREELSSVFWRQNVFPGSQLVHLSEVIAAAENAGFEVIDAENLRPHYALTCRHWVARLQQNCDACLRAVDARTYRSWLLFLASGAVSFEEGYLDVFQLLLAPRGSSQRPLTRDYMYEAWTPVSRPLILHGSAPGIHCTPEGR
jgi:cyclopropane-fatty-acyl-phospholipid synthase